MAHSRGVRAHILSRGGTSTDSRLCSEPYSRAPTLMIFALLPVKGAPHSQGELAQVVSLIDLELESWLRVAL